MISLVRSNGRAISFGREAFGFDVIFNCVVILLLSLASGRHPWRGFATSFFLMFLFVISLLTVWSEHYRWRSSSLFMMILRDRRILLMVTGGFWVRWYQPELSVLPLAYVNVDITSFYPQKNCLFFCSGQFFLRSCVRAERLEDLATIRSMPSDLLVRSICNRGWKPTICLSLSAVASFVTSQSLAINRGCSSNSEIILDND